MDEPSRNDVTTLLRDWRAGDAGALEQLTPLVYDELRRLARIKMQGERPDHSLDPTGLVHEAFVRLVDVELTWQDRTHFLSVAAKLMRRVLVDHARARDAKKRGGDVVNVTLTGEHRAPELAVVDILALHQALERLEQMDERQARVVELHYFGGVGYPEIGTHLDVSQATVERDMRHARAWLRRELA